MTKTKLLLFFLMLSMLVPAVGMAKKKRKKKYPIKVNSRPLVLPRSMNEVGAALTYSSVEVAGVSASATALGVGFKRGIIKGLELGGTTGLALDPEFDWSKSFALQTGYRLAYKKKKGLSLAAQLAIPLNFGEGADVLSNITAGVATRYRINKMYALHTGEGLLSLGFGDEVTTRINIPIGVAIQISRQFNLRFDTRLLSFGSGGSVIIGDSLPINLQGLFSIDRMMDVGVLFNKDVVLDGSPTTLMAVFNYRMK
jgi:hypothetical protein